jgi:sugar transferase (PEP-CTERM system associated)
VSRISATSSVASGVTKRRILVFGTGVRAHEVKQALIRSDPSAEIVGFFTGPNESNPIVPSTQIVSSGKTLYEAALATNAQEIVVAISERRGGSMPLRDLLDCKLRGIKVLDLPSYFERTLGQIRLDSVYAGWLIFGDGFNQGRARAVIKRVSDIVFSLILVVITLPIMIVTALVIGLESGFPILYRQERVGLNGRLFNVVKFRSMRRDAEKDGKPVWATSADNRVTKVGGIIRKLRVDELPQLFSVLKGDMSLIGPRPERPFFVDQLTREIPFYAVRHSVKPGVTGWAQVCYHYGATVEDSAEKLQYDLYYVKNQSLFLDLVILFETVGVVVTGKGAH